MSLIPIRRAAGMSSPLSVPTPGSTTPTWTANGKCGAAWNIANAPSLTCPGATSWRTSTMFASRLIPRITPFIAATYSDAPKSVVRVTITRPRRARYPMTLPPDPSQAFPNRLDLLALPVQLLVRRPLLRLAPLQLLRAFPDFAPLPVDDLGVPLELLPLPLQVPRALLEPD